jgi:glycosyltransferase involved in cell wall biosynthesis
VSATEPTVLHVLEALSAGTSRHLVDLVRHAEHVRHIVAIPDEERERAWPTDRQAPAELRAAGAEVHVVDMVRSPLGPPNWRALRTLRRLIADLRPDIVHGHSSIGGALARLAALGTGAARVYTPNGVAEGLGAFGIERTLGLCTDRFVAVSPSEGALAVSRRLVPPQRLRVIRNGIDLEPPPQSDRSLRDELGLSPATPIVVCVGRLAPQKCPEDFVRAGALVGRRHGDVCFLMVGAGPQQAAVDRAVGEAGPQLLWRQISYVPEVARYLSQCDVFLMPSRYEGGPYAPLEAMRANVPVVLTDCVGSRDVIDDRRSGRLVSVGDVGAMARAVAELLADPALAARLASAAKDRLAECFDVRRQGEATAALYRELAN